MTTNKIGPRYPIESDVKVAKQLGPIVSYDAVRVALIRAGVKMRDTQGQERAS